MDRGKWSRPGYPHKGWQCEDIEDLGSPDATCEMCEAQPIRYVHYMSHPDVPELLSCGCECAGHMESNYAVAESRDKKMKNAASRKRRFPTLKGWKLSEKGNWTIKRGFARVTVFQKGDGYKYVIHIGPNDKGKFSPRVYKNTESAKLASFDTLSFLGIEHI